MTGRDLRADPLDGIAGSAGRLVSGGLVAEAYIVGAVRTPVGRRNGGLSAVNPVDLAAHVLTELVARTGADPAAIDDVVMGCVSQIGPQSVDIARQAWLSAGLPESVPGVTIDRQCGSSQQAVHFAAQAVLSGTQDLVVAAGVESMSVVPMGSTVTLAMEKGMPPPFGKGWRGRYGDQEISQFRGAQLICEKWGIKRAQLEEFALESHTRALHAIDEGRFEREITPVGGLTTDEGPRRDTSLEKMAGLMPLREGYDLTAATSSQISDGAAAVLVASEAAIQRYGLKPRARIHTLTVTGSDPVYMMTGPIAATDRVLAKAGLDVADIDVFEVNEAFASVVIAWSADTGGALERTNPNGGAIALGHPLGATGAVLMTKLLHELERTGGRYGLQTMCEGGGQANATIIERLG
jgi:acetyl-CoA C-acetyltransferase